MVEVVLAVLLTTFAVVQTGRLHREQHRGREREADAARKAVEARAEIIRLQAMLGTLGRVPPSSRRPAGQVEVIELPPYRRRSA